MNVERLVELGGKEWAKGENHRVYFNDPSVLIGLEIDTYKTGNIKSAFLDGEKISNSKACKLMNSVYFDAKKGEFVGCSNIIDLIKPDFFE